MELGLKNGLTPGAILCGSVSHLLIHEQGFGGGKELQGAGLGWPAVKAGYERCTSDAPAMHTREPVVHPVCTAGASLVHDPKNGRGGWKGIFCQEPSPQG